MHSLPQNCANSVGVSGFVQGVGRLLIEAVFKLADDESVQDVLVRTPHTSFPCLIEALTMAE